MTTFSLVIYLLIKATCQNMHGDMISTVSFYLTFLNKLDFFSVFMTCVAEIWHAFGMGQENILFFNTVSIRALEIFSECIKRVCLSHCLLSLRQW